MRHVGEILSRFEWKDHAISPMATIHEALARLSQDDKGALLVVNEGQVVGILSERDCAQKVVLQGKSTEEVTVKECMSDEVITVHPTHSTEVCLALMNEHRIRHLPVILETSGEILGFLSVLDVIQSLLDDKKEMISQYESYVSELWPF